MSELQGLFCKLFRNETRKAPGHWQGREHSPTPGGQRPELVASSFSKHHYAKAGRMLDIALLQL